MNKLLLVVVVCLYIWGICVCVISLSPSLSCPPKCVHLLYWLVACGLCVCVFGEAKMIIHIYNTFFFIIKLATSRSFTSPSSRFAVSDTTHTY